MSNAVTDKDFDDQVLLSDQPVLVDFWAPWCGPCRQLGPVIEELGQENEGRAKVFKLNVDENPETAGHYAVRSIPTMILFKGGKPAGTLVGFQPKAVIQGELDKLAG